MAKPKILLRRLYKKYIYPFDPAGYCLLHAIKTLVAIFITLALFRTARGMVVWAAMASYCISAAEAGDTLRFRKWIVLATGLTAALLVPLATGLSETIWPATFFLLVVAFFCFYSNVLGPAFGGGALWALILCVLALGKAGSWGDGLARSLAVLSGGAIAYVIHFWILPLRPAKLLQDSLDTLLTNLDDLFEAVSRAYADPDTWTERVEKAQERTLATLDQFRRLPELLQPGHGAGSSREAAILSLGIDLERLFGHILALWHFRNSGRRVPLYEKVLPGLTDLVTKVHAWFREFSQTIWESEKPPDSAGLLHDLEVFKKT